MEITRSDISRVIDNPAYYQRGVSYFSDRKVLNFRLELDGYVVGSVAGSEGRVYSVDVTLGRGADGRLSDVDGQCSCPIGYNCKHVTAVLLEVAHMLVDVLQKPATSQNPNRAQTSVKANLPGSVMTWFDRFSLIDTHSPTPTVLKTSNNQIFFVFRQSHMSQAEIAPYKAYVKKAEITSKRIRRGSYTSVDDLETAIYDCLVQHNAKPKPFTWTKTAEDILARERRALDKLNEIRGNR